MKNNKLIPFLSMMAFFNMAANFVHPVTPTLIVERGLDSSLFGVAYAAMMIMYFLFSPFWGKLSDYVPTRRIIMICSFGYAVGQTIFGAAQTEAMVIFGRMFAGIFTGGAYTSFVNYVVNTALTKEERSRNLTTLATVQSVASALGFFIGGMLGILSVEAAFAVQVAVLVACGVLCRFCCVDDTQFREKPEKALSFAEVNPFSAFLDAGKFMTPMLFLIFAIIAISAIGQNSYEQCFNYYLKDRFGMSSAYNGAIKAAIAFLTLVLNSTLCVYLQKKTEINRTSLYVTLACTVLLAVILLFSNRVLFIAVYILYNGLNAVRFPLIQTMTANRANTSNSNSVMGFYQAMNSLGAIFGALFAGIIYAKGAMLPFILAFATFAIATLLSVVYWMNYKKQPGNETV